LIRRLTLIEFMRDIKIEHSLFALPFAIATLFFISFRNLNTVLAVKLLIAIVCARSFAMGMNRFLDYKFDAKNPRTRQRAIPAGRMSARQTLSWTMTFAILFLTICATISPIVLYCSAPLLVILGSYSLMKRHTVLTHFYLGFCLGLSPIAVSVALGESISLALILMSLAVMLWTAGFDLLYSLQDLVFDQNEKLYSIPSHYGPRVTLQISRLCFAGMIAALFYAGVLAEFGWIYFAGISLIGFLLIIEHILVRDAAKTGHSKYLNFTFFNLNAFVSVLFLIVCSLDYIL